MYMSYVTCIDPYQRLLPPSFHVFLVHRNLLENEMVSLTIDVISLVVVPCPRAILREHVRHKEETNDATHFLPQNQTPTLCP